MDSWHAVRYVYQLGSPISGIVTSREELRISPKGRPEGKLTLKTDSEYPAILAYADLVDDLESFSPDIIPEIGTQVDAVIKNFVDDTIYLSAKPSDLLDSTIRNWQDYYDYIDTLMIGQKVNGFVTWSMQFGLFVDFGDPYIGLIDIGHTRFSGGVPLPRNPEEWPKESDSIRCSVEYFRLHDQQIGLGWVPENEV